MKTLILLTSLLFSFQFSNAQCRIDLLSGSEMYMSSICYKDSICFWYKDYKISVYRPNYSSDHIRIVDSTNRTSNFYEEHATYFYGIIDNKMIIDIGTSNIRDFKVYNLDDMSLVFSSTYFDRISANCKTIKFEFPLDSLKETFIKPDCPDKKKFEEWGSVGYVETREYRINTNELIKSGNIKCVYFE